MFPNNNNETNEPRNCPICWTSFTPNRTQPNKHTYCSPRCRAEAGRRRQDQQPTPATDIRPEPTPTITRDCPHCGEPITIVTLLTTPHAARPSIPDQPQLLT